MLRSCTVSFILINVIMSVVASNANSFARKAEKHKTFYFDDDEFDFYDDDNDNSETENLQSESDSLESSSFEPHSFESHSFESSSFESNRLESHSFESDSLESHSFESHSLESDSLESDIPDFSYIYTTPNNNQYNRKSLHKQEKYQITTTEYNNQVDRNCPNTESAFSVDDLERLVDNVTVSLSILENINASYYNDAKDVHDRYYNDFKVFVKELTDRPLHAKDIIKELESIRLKRITPKLKELADKLKKIPSMESVLNENLNKSRYLFSLLDQYRQICSLNCHNNDIILQQSRYVHYPSNLMINDEDQYYCGRLDEVVTTIQDSLYDLQYQMNSNFSEFTENYNDTLAEALLNRKRFLKKRAVNMFGDVMYDLLSLEDDYYRFYVIFKSNITTQLHELKKNIYKINDLVNKLSDSLPDYKEYCLDCEPTNLNSNSRLASLRNPSSTNSNQSLLNDVISNKKKEIRKQTSHEFLNIFLDVIDIIVNRTINANILNNLNPMEKELQDDIKKESDELLKIKEMIPESTQKKLSQISKSAFQIYNELQNAVKFISQYVYVPM